MIKAKYIYTEDTAVRSTLETTRSVVKSVRWAPWLGVFLLGVSIYSSLFFGDGLNSIFTPIFFGGIIFISVPFMLPYFARRDFRTTPTANKEVTWEIGEEGLETWTDSSQAKFEWSQLLKIKETKHGFLLFPQPRVAYWIPKEAFNAESDMNNFRELFQRKLA